MSTLSTVFFHVKIPIINATASVSLLHCGMDGKRAAYRDGLPLVFLIVKIEMTGHDV